MGRGEEEEECLARCPAEINSLKYYCKDSETQHKQAACPKCDLR